MTVAVADFGEFLEAVHGHRPFRWQTELAEQVISTGTWPTALDVPTGMGKTVALDVAVFALAAQASLPSGQRTAPTRTFLVVDRRVIVDQAHERAQRISAALAEAPAESVLAAVADSLRSVAGQDAPPLQAVRMRGGTTWSSRWLTSARHPAIITGTVDQLGSRMLFRGYGVSDRMRPVDAALCGNDSLVLLDEAHLSAAFLQTVDAVRDAEQQAATAVLRSRRPSTVVLSATLRDRATAEDRPFRCDPSPGGLRGGASAPRRGQDDPAGRCAGQGRAGRDPRTAGAQRPRPRRAGDGGVQHSAVGQAGLRPAGRPG